MSRFDPPHILDPDHDDTDRESLDEAWRFFDDMEPDMTSRPLSPLPSYGVELAEWQCIELLFAKHGQAAPPVALRDELVVLLQWARRGFELDEREARQQFLSRSAMRDTHYET